MESKACCSWHQEMICIVQSIHYFLEKKLAITECRRAVVTSTQIKMRSGVTCSDFTLPGCVRRTLEPCCGDRGMMHLYSATGGGGGSFCTSELLVSPFGETGASWEGGGRSMTHL